MNNNLRDRLDQHKSEISTNELDWEALGPAIMDGFGNKRKSKRRALFWFFGSFVLLAGILAGYYVSSPTPFSGDQLSAMTSTSPVDAKEFSVDTDEKTTSNTSTSDERPAIIKNDQQNSKYTQVSSTKKPSEKKEEITSSEWSIKANTPLPASSSINNKKRDEPSNLIESANQTNNSVDLDQLSIDVKEDQRKSIYEPENDINQRESSRDLLMINSLGLDQKMPLFKLPPFLFDSSSIEIKENLEKPKSAYFSLNANYTTSFSDIYKPYQYTSSRFGSEMGIESQYTTKRSLRISVGITRSIQNFRTSFDQEESIKVYQPETIDTIFRDRNGIELFTFKDSINAIRLRKFGHSSSLTSYNIPLGIGYVFGGNTYRVSLLGGPIITLFQTFNGRISAIDYSITDLTNNSFGVNVGLHANINIEKQVGQSLFLLFGAQAARIKSRHQIYMVNSYGVRIGAGWKF